MFDAVQTQLNLFDVAAHSSSCRFKGRLRDHLTTNRRHLISNGLDSAAIKPIRLSFDSDTNFDANTLVNIV